MSTIVTRAGKGSPLTHTEVDNNFTNLNTDKYQSGDNASFGTLAATGDVSIADKIVHAGDTNTAIRFPSADTVTVETDGTERLRITSTGAVQLSNNLTFTGTGNRITGDFSNATIANRVIFQGSTANSSSFVGIIPNGTDTTTRLDLYSTSTPLNSARFSLVSLSTEHSIRSAIDGSGSYLPLTMFTGGSERLRIDTSGNVGIGTSSPRSVLDARYTSTAPSLTSATGVGFSLGGSSSVLLNVGSYPTSPFASWMQATSLNNDTFPIVLNPLGGNVGIGTSSPANPLAIYRGSSVAAFIDLIGNGNTAGTSNVVIGQNADDGGYFWNRKSSFLSFGTSNTERMRITSGGDIYCGQSSYTFNVNPTTGTDIVAGGLIINATRRTTGASGNTLWDSAGVFYRSTSSLKYKRDVENMQYGLNEVMSLRPVTFSSKSEVDGNSRFGGFIAEEIDALGLKEFVSYDQDNSPDGLQYANMVALLAKAIQEQQAMIEELKAEVALLKSK